ncbi:MAG: cis-prenyltransferase [Pycnora praestabilis]|nr:MAG: cis-prenyltransferase [Pycnora praestabilis]
MAPMHLFELRRWLLSSPPAEWAIQQLRELLIGALRQGPIPQHVAFVMDGNRRYARSHQIETVEGHNLGFEALARILEVCYKSGVKVVTIYAFSIENFKRSKYEVDALMDMAKVKLSQLAQHGDLLDRYGASVRILGERGMVKPDVLEAIDKAVQLTSGNKHAILNVCFPYTSRDEITSAIRSTVIDYSRPLPSLQRPFSESHIAQNIRSRHLSSSSTAGTYSPPSESSTPDNEDSTSSSTTLNPESPPNHELSGNPEGAIYPDPETITSEILTNHMYTAGTPPLDLLVRTSGVERLSDFMLWQSHQDTEIVFLECLWPEFDLQQFLPVLVEWQWRRKQVEEKDRATAFVHMSRAVKVR